MNTLTNISYIEKSGRRDHVILLEDLEFGMPKKQLKTITKLHNEGMSLKDISTKVRRNQYEVLIALLHQVKKGYVMRPFAFKEVKK